MEREDGFKCQIAFSWTLGRLYFCWNYRSVIRFHTFFREGPFSTSVLLGIMGVLFIYICFFRSSKAVFKESGLFYALLFFPYAKIERMNLSEDGVLVIETNRQRLMLFARSEKDLEKMLAVFTTYS